MCCRDSTVIGTMLTLPKFDNPSQMTKREVRFMSKNFTPLRYFCRTHTATTSKTVNVWLWDSKEKKYCRCILE